MYRTWIILSFWKDCYLTKVPVGKELPYFKYLWFGKYFSDLDILDEPGAVPDVNLPMRLFK